MTKEAQKKTEELKAQTAQKADEEATAEPVKAPSEKKKKAETASTVPLPRVESVRHSSQKAINFFSGLEAQEAKATIESVKDEKPKTVRTLNWAELAVNDANEAEKKEAAKEGREPEKTIEGPRERLNREVIEMAEAGMDKVEIAKKLKMGVGEVGLILDLHNR